MTKLTNVGLAQMAAEPADVDRLYIVDDPAGSPTSKYIEYGDLASNLAKLDAANTFASHIVMDSGAVLYKSVNTSSQTLSGGTGAATGANIVLYGGAHATYPGWTIIRDDTSSRITINDSGHVGINDSTPDAQLDITANGTSTIGLIVNTAALATANAQEWDYNGATAGYFKITASERMLLISDFDNGASYGPRLAIGFNNGANPVVGTLSFSDPIAGQAYYIWSNNGELRMGTTRPISTNVGSTGGPVGTQTSQRATKNIIGDAMSPTEALAIIAETPVYEFTYKSDIRAEPQTYYGITTDDSPLFGWDNGKAFNPVNANGITIQAIKALLARIVNLEAQLQGA